MLIEKNARKALVLVFCAIFFLSLPAMVHASPASQALVVEGRDLLFNEGDFIVSGILAADTKFEAAVTADPGDEEANFFYAVTRVLVFGLEQDNGPNFDTLATLGDLLGAFGMLRNTNDFIDEGDGPFNEPPEIYDDYDPPDTIPSGEEIRTFFAGPFVSLMDSAIGNLDVVSSSFETTLYAWETGDMDIEVDYGDVMIVKSWLHTLKSFALIISAYDLDIPDTRIRGIIALDNADLFQFQRDLLDIYADVFKLRGDGSTSLTNAKDALMLGIDRYRDSISFIINETDFQEDDLLFFDSKKDEHSAQHILTLLTELQSKLNINEASIFTTTEQKWLLTDGGTSGQLNLEIELDPDDNIADESAWGAVFGLNGNGTVDDYSIDGSIVTMVLVADSYPCPGSSSFSTFLTGTISGDQITGGTYTGTDCSGPISGTFTGVRTCEETDSETIDFGWLFGNTGKDQLDIRATLPQFDSYDEPIPGSFPSPVLNNLLPDYTTNDGASLKFDLQPNGNFSLPSATITIDGASADWPVGAVVFTDVSGDGDPDRPGTDIEKVYLATDGADLCMAISLYDANPNTDINTYYKFRFRKKGDDSQPEAEIWLHYNGTIWEGGARKGPQYGWETISLSGGSAASGTKFLELKVPLADIETAVGSLNGTFVSVYIDTAPLDPNCDVREYEEDNDTKIKLNSTAGISGTITCSAHTSGAISIWVYDDSNIDTANVLGSTYIAAPGPYIIDGLPDDADVFVLAVWDINSNGILNFGDYYGHTPALVTLTGGSTTTVDIDVNNTLDNTWMKTKPGKYRLFGSNTYTFEGSYGSDPNEIDWHDSNWTYIDEGDSTAMFSAAEYYDTILMMWHENSNFFFDSFEDETLGKGKTAFATDEGGSPVIYQWVTRGLVNSDNTSSGGEPHYFKGYADEWYTMTQDGYGFNLFTMPSDSLPFDDDRQLKVTFDRDTDDDGLMDHVETDIGSNPLVWDTDGDRMPDGWEYTHGLNPIIDDSTYDRDQDGVSNLEEYFNGSRPDILYDSYNSGSFTVKGSVMNRHHQDGSFSSLISVVIGGDFTGSLPEDIEYITVEGPSGYLPYGKNDYTYFSPWREFDLVIPGSPDIGEYTFIVKQKGDAMGKARDIQGVNRTIPVPTTLSPAPDETVTSKTPIFSWQAVEYPDTPLYYRLQIKDDADDLVLSTDREHGMLSCTAPVLNPGQTYYWRVRVSDSDDFVKVQNRSQTDWIPFTVVGSPTHSAIPAIDLPGFGVLTFTTADGTNLDIELNIIDHDGVSYDGSSHTVEVTFPGGSPTYEMEFGGYVSATVGYYRYWLNLGGSPATPGTYTITVTDPDGNVATPTDDLVVQTLDPPDETSFTPSNYNPVQENITATFDNVYVNGSLYDNFDSYGTNIDNLDPFKWNWWDSSVSSIENQKLKHTVSNTIGRGQSGVNFADPESINAIQADITITDTSNVDNRAEIAGYFCSKGIKDIFAKISVEGDRVWYYVDELWISQGNFSWNTLATGDLMTGAFTGQTVTVSIAWDGSMFTFDADGNTATYTPTGPIYAPIFSNGKTLRTRIDLVTDTTPTFTWDPVLNANRHRVRIYSSDNSQTIWKGWTGTEGTHTVPPGILTPNSLYRYRIDSLDAHSTLNVSNFSKAPASSNDNYVFYTGEEEAVDPFIDLDNHGVGVWNSELAGPILDFWIKVHDAQGVPGNIKTVKVTFPSSAEEILYFDEGNRYNTSTCGIYRSNSFLPIESGTYTFYVEDQDGHTHTLAEDLTDNSIGYPAESSLTPVHNTLVGDTAVDFDWEDVTGAAFYRVEIYDKDYNRIYAFGTTDSQFNLSAGFLEEETLYRYRITTRREFFDQNVDNVSSSPWGYSTAFTFNTTSVTGGSASPILDLENEGVYVWRAVNQGQPATSYYWLMFHANVTDDDGVPGNIASVRVTYPDGVTTKDLIYDEELSSTQATYWGVETYGNPASIPQGTYTFRVTDFDGNYVELTDNLTVSVLPAPANLVPGQDSTVVGTTPTVFWDDVTGASRYRVRIYDGWDGTVHWSDYLTSSSYTVPADVLELNTTYSYRVYAYREQADTEDVDNVSINSLYESERSHFTTGSTETDSDGDGIPDDSDPCPNDYYNDIDGDDICGDVDTCPNDPDNDIDGDGFCADLEDCPSDPDKQDPGICGCNTPDTDTDFDGTADCIDNFPDNPDNKPTLDSPPNEALLGDVSETLLISSGFVDTATVTLVETQWQIRRADRMYGCADYDASFSHTATSGDLTLHTVSGLESGMQYAWRVGYVDSDIITTWSDEYTFTVGVSETDTSVHTTPGITMADYRMVSFVHWPDDPTATAVLGDELGTSYDIFQFRIGTYDPELGGYIEYDGDLEIEPGRAYWVLARNGLDVSLDGVPVSLSNDMEVGLSYNSGTGDGWKMVGCPNDAKYYWEDVQVIEYDGDGNIVFGPTAVSALSDPNDYIDTQLWQWETGSYASYLPGDNFLMEKHKGYWVKAKKANVYLRFPVSAQTTALSNPRSVMLASFTSRAKRWLKKWILTPQAAIAGSGESPPMPMGELNTTASAPSGGYGESGGGCFIATAAYGSPMAPHVTVLREFRDRFMLSNSVGKVFVDIYYKTSPAMADFITRHASLKPIVRISLLPIVGTSWMVLNHGAISAIALMLFFIIGVIALLQFRRKKIKG